MREALFFELEFKPIFLDVFLCTTPELLAS